VKTGGQANRVFVGDYESARGERRQGFGGHEGLAPDVLHAVFEFGTCDVSAGGRDDEQDGRLSPGSEEFAMLFGIDDGAWNDEVA